MKQRILAVLFGLVFCTPLIWSQTSGFSQQGKVTHEMRDEGFSIAHSSLPLNSKAKIVNTSTGKEVDVTITRLIPASQSRIADVSSRVWQELGLTSDTDARIYTVVSAKPQPAASTTVASQTAAPQTTASPAAVRPQDSAAETSPFGNMPSSVKFENNNNFIVNGNPVAPSAVAYETRTQQGGGTAVPSTTDPASVTYYETQPAQPAVTYETRPQQTQPAVVGDMWAQITRPAIETRPQQVQPAVTYETQPQQAQPSITYYETRPAQPVVRIENQPQTYQPIAPYETRPGQPVVKIVNWPESQQPYETRTQQSQSAVTYETRTQQAPVIPAEKKPEILPNKVNEIVSPETRTFVFIDAPPQAMPSVTIDNGPQSYRSVPAQGRDRK